MSLIDQVCEAPPSQFITCICAPATVLRPGTPMQSPLWRATTSYALVPTGFSVKAWLASVDEQPSAVWMAAPGVVPAARTQLRELASRNRKDPSVCTLTVNCWLRTSAQAFCMMAVPGSSDALTTMRHWPELPFLTKL